MEEGLERRSLSLPFRIGDVTIDPRHRTIFRGGEALNLPPHYVAILVRLAEDPRVPVTRDELKKAIKDAGGGTVSGSTLEKGIEEIRRVLGYELVQTVRNVGYRLMEVPEPVMPIDSQNQDEAPKPQLTRWAPVDGGPPGIYIGSRFGQFISWSELIPEIEERLLSQLGRVLTEPGQYTVRMEDMDAKRDWLVRVIAPSGDRVGDVWFGPDPDTNWKWDGLVRVGREIDRHKSVVWQVFQRYSDGSYRRLKAIF